MDDFDTAKRDQFVAHLTSLLHGKIDPMLLPVTLTLRGIKLAIEKGVSGEDPVLATTLPTHVASLDRAVHNVGAATKALARATIDACAEVREVLEALPPDFRAALERGIIMGCRQVAVQMTVASAQARAATKAGPNGNDGIVIAS